MQVNFKKHFGPGAMVAAAFIGPGTVTTATLAGANYGYVLLWAIVFSIVATFILQEMAARLGLVGQMGLGEAIRRKANLSWSRFAATALVIGAIWIGNAAYEAGNLTGAVLGFSPHVASTTSGFNPLLWIIAALAIALLFYGKYQVIERVLVALVSVMGFIFIVTAFLVKPDLSEIISGIFRPALPPASTLVVVGLIGTTVVPYNLFLHASAVQKKWTGAAYLKVCRRDTLLSVVVGGLITIAIVVSSASAIHGKGLDVQSAADLSIQLKPLLGSWAEPFLAAGFLAAGLTSAITAPLAASFATCGIMGWSSDMQSVRFRLVWIFVIVAGVVSSSIGLKPIMIILFAQVANGLLLPVIALFLLWIMNDRTIMGAHSNTKWSNLAGIFVVLLSVGLGIKSVLSAFHWI
ncbi:MAG: Nramp family divalent metal transporter [Saprospiraceae bacterium]|nr:Nramp family divalent metal transporter [Saprospiraceae bacterium]